MCLASNASGDVTQLNGVEWLPLITQRPVQEITWFDGDTLTYPTGSYGSIDFYMSPDFDNDKWSGYDWPGALARFWTGEEGEPFSSYVQRWEGCVSGLDRDGIIGSLELIGAEALLTGDLLSDTYAGSGGAEGAIGLKGTLKPRAFGTCQSVEGIQVDAANLVYQVDGYRAVQSIPAVYEFAQSLGTSKGDFASYAALIAAPLVPGEWATCHAQGMFRLGGRPDKKLTCDVVAAGGSTVSTILTTMLTIGGVDSSKIGTLPFASVSWNLYQTSQVSVLDAARECALQAGGLLFADPVGKWQVMDYYSPKAAQTISVDGTTYPVVTSVSTPRNAPPIWKVDVGYNRVWAVHSENDVSDALKKVSDAQIADQATMKLLEEQASKAASDAALAVTRVNAIGDDGVLDTSEKADLVFEVQTYTNERPGLLNQAKSSTFNVTAQANAYPPVTCLVDVTGY
jgi:hypothetical protein